VVGSRLAFGPDGSDGGPFGMEGAAWQTARMAREQRAHGVALAEAGAPGDYGMRAP
jgi:hypothetical protein